MSTFPNDYCVAQQTNGGGGGTDFSNYFAGGGGSVTLSNGVQVDAYYLISRIDTWVAEHRMTGIQIWLSNSPSGWSENDLSVFQGATGGTHTSFQFMPGERLATLNVAKSKYNDKTYCGGIEFTTTLGRSFSAVNPSGGSSVAMDVGYGACVGIYGAAGEAIDCLGFWMIQQPSSLALSNVTYKNAPPPPAKNTLDSRVFTNNSSKAETVSYTQTYSVSTTEDWSLTTSNEQQVGFTVGTEASVYFVTASAETSYSWTTSQEETNGLSYSSSEEYSVNLGFELQPGESSTLTVFNYQGDYVALDYDGFATLKLPNNTTFAYCLSGSSSGASGSSVFYDLS